MTGLALLPHSLRSYVMNVGNFLVGQRFVPRLHDSSAVLLALNRDRALQTLENNHRQAAASRRL